MTTPLREATAPSATSAPARAERILICDELSAEALEVFAAHGLKPEVCPGPKEAEPPSLLPL